MKKYLILIGLIFSLFCELLAQTINIGLFHKYQLKSILVSPVFGDYNLIGDDEFDFYLSNNSILYLTLVDDQIKVKSAEGINRYFSKIELKGEQNFNTIRIKSDSPKLKAREYEGDFKIYVQKGHIKIVNSLELEDYIAGVVESEGGVRAEQEYYKTQAVLCRTYALGNFNKHGLEGFNLCDGVHCQAYLSRAKESDLIVKSTNLTQGLVIVDASLDLITAAFYSNSGGQTAASETVWQQARTYLRSIVDTFSVGQKNFKWIKKISYSKWCQFLKKNGFKLAPSIKGSDFVSNNFIRQKYYKFGQDSIPYTVIRQSFGLRSTYFTIRYEDNFIVLVGRGYGHGVGLSQEGAMAMAIRGYSYKEIISFYYQNVFVVSLSALRFFQD